MRYFAGLDVSLEETAICVVDENGVIVKEVRATSEPGALMAALRQLLVAKSKMLGAPRSFTSGQIAKLISLIRPARRKVPIRRHLQAAGIRAPVRTFNSSSKTRSSYYSPAKMWETPSWLRPARSTPESRTSWLTFSGSWARSKMSSCGSLAKDIDLSHSHLCKNPITIMLGRLYPPPGVKWRAACSMRRES